MKNTDLAIIQNFRCVEEKYCQVKQFLYFYIVIVTYLSLFVCLDDYFFRKQGVQTLKLNLS